MSLNAKNILRSLGNWVHDHPDGWLNVLGAIIGALTAMGAVLFAHGLLEAEHLTEHLQGEMSWWMLPLIPMAGAVLTGILVFKWAPEAGGHGVPQVLDAIIRKGGRIPARIGFVKVIASVCTVGTGGSAGAEGPIVQIGAVAGSVLSKRIGVTRQQTVVLVGCGAAAGISSIFNAPIAGVFFALEILLRDFSLKTFTPIVIASVFATAMTQVLLGDNDAIFSTQLPNYVFSVLELPSYIVLGVLCAFGAWFFTMVLEGGEDIFGKMKLHPILKPVLGALMLGLLGLVGMWLFSAMPGGELLGQEHDTIPAFFGNGYSVIRHLLNPETYVAGHVVWGAVGVLAILMVAKVFATTFTLASGGSGGIFAPGLFTGASIGGVFGIVLDKMGLIADGSSPASYALVGMAAVIAGCTFAPMTSILILFEITREPHVLAPIMLAAIVSTAVTRKLMPDSIYNAKLRRAGVRIGTSRDMSMLRHVPVSSVDYSALPPEPIYASDPLSKLISLHAHHNVPDFPVVDADGKYMGMVTGSDMRTALIDREAIPLLLVAELMRTDFPVIKPDEHLDTVIEKFSKHEISSLVLVDGFTGEKPIALVTRMKVMARYNAVLDEG
ncbi:MAG: chloride channel protein [Phycisphaerales bacterium]